MSRLVLIGVALASSGFAFAALAEGDLKPSFKPGDPVQPFNPYNVTGRSAGKSACPV